MRYLVTGGCGFVGSNLANAVLQKGDELFVLDSLYREGAAQNLQWLKSQGDIQFFHVDLRSYNDVEHVLKESKPDVIFHLSGQVAMTTSIQNPRFDFETNVVGGHNLLEAVRKVVPEAIMTYSSTNKVYGDFEYLEFEEQETRYVAKGYENGFDENVSLDFRSPYGCSKGAVDQYMLDYARIFGLNTIVFRHSSVFGGRQFSTFDQGWIGWFTQQGVQIEQGRQKEKFTIAGDGKQVRDVLFIDDLISCYFQAIAKIDKNRGEAFNIGGGMSNSLSLLELFSFLEQELKIKMEYIQTPWRESDQRVFVADITKAKKYYQWEPKVDKATGLKKMIEWVKENESN